MFKESEWQGSSEWRLNVADEELATKGNLEESSTCCCCCCCFNICKRLQASCGQVLHRLWTFLGRAWDLGKNDPKKLMHCIKVGMALCVVSLFYYMRPLYDGVGGNAMWAVMTVVVVYEYTVGATLCKCVNRTIGTLAAGSLGIGVHWVANKCGDKMEPIILQLSVFLLATAATFSRFIPSIKARFDYGAMIFILTFSLVSVSGYRVDKLFEMAHSRLSTIAIGTSICIITSMLFCPVWAGYELHCLITANIQKLSDSLAECIEYGDAKDDGSSTEKSLAYRSVLNSKATEESLVNFARWEPAAHGNFGFRHPWKQYLKVGASLRACAYYIETLNSTFNSKSEEPDLLKKHLGEPCNRLRCNCSNVLKELAIMMTTMTKSSEICSLVQDMSFSAQDLQDALKFLPIVSNSNSTQQRAMDPSTKVPQTLPLMEIVPLLSAASLLIEIATRVKQVFEAINVLANAAEFEPHHPFPSPSPSPKNGDIQDDHRV